jgi:hypothetical protein
LPDLAPFTAAFRCKPDEVVPLQVGRTLKQFTASLATSDHCKLAPFMITLASSHNGLLVHSC